MFATCSVLYGIEYTVLTQVYYQVYYTLSQSLLAQCINFRLIDCFNRNKINEYDVSFYR